MFDTFTDRARKAIAFAQMESERFRHDSIGTEHLLLGLVRAGSGVAVIALTNLGADMLRVRREVETQLVKGDQASPGGPLPFTPQAKRVLDLAVEESGALGHPYVGTEHILLGLLSDPGGVAAQVLIRLGLKLDEVRSKILDLLGEDEVSQVTMHPPVSEAPEPAESTATELSKGPIPPPTTERDALPKPDHITFDLFSNRALRIIALAHQEAERFHRVSVDTEHLLLGLVQVDGGVAAALLKDLGVDSDKVCREVENRERTSEKATANEPPAFAPQAKRVLDLALVEARAHGLPYICDEHILLGILTEQDCMGARVLIDLGLNLDQFRQELLDMLGANDVSGVVNDPSVVRSASLVASLRLHVHARKEVEALGHEHIAAEHFLLCLLQGRDSIAVQMLVESGVDPDALRQRIRDNLKGRKQRPDGSFGPVENEDGTGAGDNHVT